LPDKTYQTIPVEMSTKQAKLYNDLKNDFMATDEDTGHEVDTSSVLAQLTRMRQLVLDPRLLGFDVVGEKTKSILEELENTNEPIIIMSMFTSYLKLLFDEIKDRDVFMLHGEMTAKEKQDAVDAFQNGEVDVLLCNIISAGTGFTLDRGEQIWFTDLPWNPSDWEQSQDRIIPTTKDKIHKSHIITFECHNTVDERINDILKQKKSLTDVIRNGNANTIRRLL
jgi:SNF2 family DNA or RNA helicase